ncbi:MAG: phosphodiesterase [Proteobacteria bacterium]|nr:phosphodiesterase [Pseudomonadota bacterium]
MTDNFTNNALALLEAKHTLLSGITAYTDINQTINQFVKTCNEALDLPSAHIYSLNMVRDSVVSGPDVIKSVKVLSRTTIPQQESSNCPDEKVLRDIVSQFIKIRDQYIFFSEDNRYFSILIAECNKLVIFDNTGQIEPEHVNELLEQSIETLSRLARVVALTMMTNNTIDESEPSDNIDQLTLLPDRRKFKYNLLKTLSNANRQNYYVAVVYLNIDNFKFINNTLGHSTGDIVISRIAERLKKLCRKGDDLYRMGGDEFTFVLNHLGDELDSATKHARRITERIITEMGRPIELLNQSLHLTSSIGISMFPSLEPVNNDSENILKQANMAMDMAKKKGKNRIVFYDDELQQTAEDYFIIFNQLITALENDEFSLAYQPMVDHNENIVGAEALLRWNNSKLGEVSPGKFIKYTEDSHLILDIGDWVLQTACEFIKKVRTCCPELKHFKYISVNVSPKQLSHPGFVKNTHKKITENGISPDDIRLEFTESMLVDDIESTIDIMKQLNNYDIQFLLDDFGTGYSSLSYLYRLPISAIKIDKTFVSGDEHSPAASDDDHNQVLENEVIVETIIAMSEKMNLKCIVEGVETRESADYFIEKNVFAIQGYFYHKPITGDEFLRLLKDEPQ